MTVSESKSGNRPITLRQLARQINVAVCTVSRALSGDPGVSPERAQEIRLLALNMGYQPKPFRRKRTNTIGLIIATDRANVADDFFQQMIILQVERKASECQKHVQVQFVLRRGDPPLWPAFLNENRVDGVILAGHPPAELCKKLYRREIPAVVIHDSVARTFCSCVSADFRPATVDAVRRLVSLGHRRIGFVVTDRKYPTVESRFMAYREALREAGIEPDPGWIIEGAPSNLIGGRQSVRHYLQAGQLPTAILFTNDWIALGAAKELIKHGYRIPEDVSLMGFDNVSICEEMDPPLTSVDGQLEAVVSEAFEVLFRQMEGTADVEERAVPGILAWRGSCGAPGPGK